jgi:hypothetical protein
MRVRATSNARAGDPQGAAPPYIVRRSIAGAAIMHDGPPGFPRRNKRNTKARVLKSASNAPLLAMGSATSRRDSLRRYQRAPGPEALVGCGSKTGARDAIFSNSRSRAERSGKAAPHGRLRSRRRGGASPVDGGAVGRWCRQPDPRPCAAAGRTASSSSRPSAGLDDDGSARVGGHRRHARGSPRGTVRRRSDRAARCPAWQPLGSRGRGKALPAAVPPPRGGGRSG